MAASEECQVAGVEGAFEEAGGERHGKKAQNRNPKEPVSGLGAVQGNVLASGRDALLGSICLWKVEFSRSSFGSPVVRGLLQATPGTVSMIFDPD